MAATKQQRRHCTEANTTWIDAQPDRWGKIYGTYPSRKQFAIQLTAMELLDRNEYLLECWHESNARCLANMETTIRDAQRWHNRAGDETSAIGLQVMRRRYEQLRKQDHR